MATEQRIRDQFQVVSLRTGKVAANFFNRGMVRMRRTRA